jgi:anti-sigma-K factor RskA
MAPADPDDRDVRDLADLRATGPGEAGDPALRRLGDVARSLREDDYDLPAPPPGVWSAISDRAGASADRPTAVEPLRPPPSRQSRWLVLAAAAAVVAVLLGLGAFVAARDSGPEVLASTVLEPLTGAEGPGEARLVESDGGRQLDVSFDGALPAADGGYYEVWLIDRQVDRMVSLGPVRADGTYDVPAGVDVEEFPVVDVSAEPADGNPTHSGASVLRGTLA